MSNSTVSVECWKPILGYESNYQVSNLGSVKSLAKGIILKWSYAGEGYPTVSLCKFGVSKTCYVHHLVAQTFIGPRPEGADICHKNGNIKDPIVTNLRYGTHHSNMRDSIYHGTHRSLERTHCTKGHELTPDNVYRRYYKSADGGPKYRDRCKQCMKVKSKIDYVRWKIQHGK